MGNTPRGWKAWDCEQIVEKQKGKQEEGGQSRVSVQEKGVMVKASSKVGKLHTPAEQR
jgi:hypothetical protein